MPLLSRRERLRRSLKVPDTPCVKSVLSVISHAPADEPDAWREPFHAWATSQCVFKDRCFGGIGCLHVHFCEWADAHNAVPCTRQTFEQLLTDAGYLHADGFVSGLILSEDWHAAHWRPEPPKATPALKPKKIWGVR
jgi:hypothetical protein